MNARAKRYIQDFKNGEHFRNNKDLQELIINFQPDPSALYVLRKELAEGDSVVRKNIVKLLGALGVACNRPDPNKIPIVRNHDIIQALLVEGFMKDDAASSDAAEILHSRCRPNDLAAFNDIFTRSLAAGSGDYIMLAAKAKTTRARTNVEALARLPRWTTDDENRAMIRIAQAALGNAVVEDEFITATVEAAKNAPAAPKNRFYDVSGERDGAAVAAHLAQLGYIGTHRSLLTACAFLRSPLKTYVIDLDERSIRRDALEAIQFNFPDERVLHAPETVSEWAAAEQFCVENLSATFRGPTPDIPTERLYPRHVRDASGRAPANTAT